VGPAWARAATEAGGCVAAECRRARHEISQVYSRAGRGVHRRRRSCRDAPGLRLQPHARGTVLADVAAPIAIGSKTSPASVACDVGEVALLVQSVISSPRSEPLRIQPRELVSREEVATIAGGGPTAVERVRVDGTSSTRWRATTTAASAERPGAVPFAHCHHHGWTGGPHETDRSARSRGHDARGLPVRADRRCIAGRPGRSPLATSAPVRGGRAVPLSRAPDRRVGGSTDRRPYSLTRGLLPPCHVPKEKFT
jgi:hypothetical protein